MEDKPKKKFIPWYFRRHTSCPDCGMVFGPAGESLAESGCMQDDSKGHWISFTCPRCEAHYDAEEFFSLNSDKYERTAVLEEPEYA